MNEVEIPTKLRSLIEAYNSDNQTAKKLIVESLGSMGDAELDAIIVIIQQLAPKNTIQQIRVAQFVFSYNAGLSLLRYEFPEDQRLGLKLLRFGNQAMSKLCGGQTCR